MCMTRSFDSHFFCPTLYICLTYKPWASEEKEKFFKIVKEYDNNWDKINDEFPDRTIPCLKRFYRRSVKLHPGVNTGKWSYEEIEKFMKWKSVEVSFKICWY